MEEIRYNLEYWKNAKLKLKAVCKCYGENARLGSMYLPKENETDEEIERNRLGLKVVKAEFREGARLWLKCLFGERAEQAEKRMAEIERIQAENERIRKSNEEKLRKAREERDRLAKEQENKQNDE